MKAKYRLILIGHTSQEAPATFYWAAILQRIDNPDAPVGDQQLASRLNRQPDFVPRSIMEDTRWDGDMWDMHPEDYDAYEPYVSLIPQHCPFCHSPRVAWYMEWDARTFRPVARPRYPYDLWRCHSRHCQRLFQVP